MERIHKRVQIVKNLKISIDAESLNIYIDKGEDKEPIHVCYWHIDEWTEDPSVAISMLNAVQLYYTNPQELCNLMGVSNYE